MKTAKKVTNAVASKVEKVVAPVKAEPKVVAVKTAKKAATPRTKTFATSAVVDVPKVVVPVRPKVEVFDASGKDLVPVEKAVIASDKKEAAPKAARKPVQKADAKPEVKAVAKPAAKSAKPEVKATAKPVKTAQKDAAPKAARKTDTKAAKPAVKAEKEGLTDKQKDTIKYLETALRTQFPQFERDLKANIMQMVGTDHKNLLTSDGLTLQTSILTCIAYFMDDLRIDVLNAIVKIKNPEAEVTAAQGDDTGIYKVEDLIMKPEADARKAKSKVKKG